MKDKITTVPLKELLSIAVGVSKENNFDGLRIISPLTKCFICGEKQFSIDMFVPYNFEKFDKRIYIMGICKKHSTKKKECSEFIEEMLEDIAHREDVIINMKEE